MQCTIFIYEHETYLLNWALQWKQPTQISCVFRGIETFAQGDVCWFWGVTNQLWWWHTSSWHTWWTTVVNAHLLMNNSTTTQLNHVYFRIITMYCKSTLTRDRIIPSGIQCITGFSNRPSEIRYVWSQHRDQTGGNCKLTWFTRITFCHASNLISNLIPSSHNTQIATKFLTSYSGSYLIL